MIIGVALAKGPAPHSKDTGLHSTLLHLIALLCATLQALCFCARQQSLQACDVNLLFGFGFTCDLHTPYPAFHAAVTAFIPVPIVNSNEPESSNCMRTRK